MRTLVLFLGFIFVHMLRAFLCMSVYLDLQVLYCRTLKLKVNASESEIMIFESGSTVHLMMLFP